MKAKNYEVRVINTSAVEVKSTVVFATVSRQLYTPDVVIAAYDAAVRTTRLIALYPHSYLIEIVIDGRPERTVPANPQGS